MKDHTVISLESEQANSPNESTAPQSPHHDGSESDKLMVESAACRDMHPNMKWKSLIVTEESFFNDQPSSSPKKNFKTELTLVKSDFEDTNAEKVNAGESNFEKNSRSSLILVEEGTLKMSDKTELLALKSDKSSTPGIDNPAFEGDNNLPNGATDADHVIGNGFRLNHNGTDHKQKDDSDFKTTEEMAEAVNLELLNMGSNVTNGINGISVKSPNSTVINMSNPYDEYFIPVNEHRKYIRGEKLYVAKRIKKDVDNSKRSRTCCAWLVGLVVLMVAICLAVLFVNKLSNEPMPGENERRFPDENVLNAGIHYRGEISTTSLIPPKLPPSPNELAPTYLKRAVEGEITIEELQFTPALSDHESNEFKSLAGDVEKELKNGLFDRATLEYGSADIYVKVINLTPEKVIQFRISWIFKRGIQNPPDPINVTTLKERLKEFFRKKDNKFLDSYQVSMDKIYSKYMFDDCSINNGNCSHICAFDYTKMLDFYCACPAHMKLDITQYNCISLSSETTGDVDVQSEPDSIPQPSSKPEPEPKSEPRPTSEIEPASEPEPKSEPKPSSEPKPKSEPEPTSEPEPKSEPEPSPEPDPKSEQQPTSTPEPKTVPEPSLELEPKTEPEPNSEPEPSSEPEPKSEPQPDSKPELKTEPEPSSEPEPKSEPEPSSEPAPKSEPQPASKPEPKAEPEPSSEPEPKTEPEPSSEPESKSEPGPSSEPEPKSEPEPEPKSEPEPEPTSEPAAGPKPEPQPSSEPEHQSESQSKVETESTVEPEPDSITETAIAFEIKKPSNSKEEDVRTNKAFKATKDVVRTTETYDNNNINSEFSSYGTSGEDREKSSTKFTTKTNTSAVKTDTVDQTFSTVPPSDHFETTPEGSISTDESILGQSPENGLSGSSPIPTVGLGLNVHVNGETKFPPTASLNHDLKAMENLPTLSFTEHGVDGTGGTSEESTHSSESGKGIKAGVLIDGNIPNRSQENGLSGSLPLPSTGLGVNLGINGGTKLPSTPLLNHNSESGEEIKAGVSIDGNIPGRSQENGLLGSSPLPTAESGLNVGINGGTKLPSTPLLNHDSGNGEEIKAGVSVDGNILGRSHENGLSSSLPLPTAGLGVNVGINGGTKLPSTPLLNHDSENGEEIKAGVSVDGNILGRSHENGLSSSLPLPTAGLGVNVGINGGTKLPSTPLLNHDSENGEEIKAGVSVDGNILGRSHENGLSSSLPLPTAGLGVNVGINGGTKLPSTPLLNHNSESGEEIKAGVSIDGNIPGRSQGNGLLGSSPLPTAELGLNVGINGGTKLPSTPLLNHDSGNGEEIKAGVSVDGNILGRSHENGLSSSLPLPTAGLGVNVGINGGTKLPSTPLLNHNSESGEEIKAGVSIDGNIPGRSQENGLLGSSPLPTAELGLNVGINGDAKLPSTPLLNHNSESGEEIKAGVSIDGNIPGRSQENGLLGSSPLPTAELGLNVGINGDAKLPSTPTLNHDLNAMENADINVDARLSPVKLLGSSSTPVKEDMLPSGSASFGLPSFGLGNTAGFSSPSGHSASFSPESTKPGNTPIAKEPLVNEATLPPNTFSSNHEIPEFDLARETAEKAGIALSDSQNELSSSVSSRNINNDNKVTGNIGLSPKASLFDFTPFKSKPTSYENSGETSVNHSNTSKRESRKLRDSDNMLVRDEVKTETKESMAYIKPAALVSEPATSKKHQRRLSDLVSVIHRSMTKMRS